MWLCRCGFDDGMRLQDLRVIDLRNLSDLHLEPGRGINIISGPNASGKTALLEAIYLLARGKSFRTSRTQELIQHQQDRLRVTATLADNRDRPVPVGAERDREQLRLRYDGAAVKSLSAHAHHFPIVLITPDSHTLLSGRPGLRRHWLDWGLFHVEPAYLEDWRNCFQVLRHRNALLKRRVSDQQHEPWEQALAQAAERLDAARQSFTGHLTQAITEVLPGLLSGSSRVEYRRGWSVGTDYLQQLHEDRVMDRERGYTGRGPHRADIEFYHDNRPARAVLSRGQTKLYVAGLMLALARLFAAYGPQPIILIDDLPAELDAEARRRFLACLAETGGQIFITAVDPDLVKDAATATTPVFHVEHGRLVEVVQ